MIKLFDAGMTMARINLSHGTPKENIALINRYKAARRLRPYMNCALMVEVRGREIRMSFNEEKNGLIRVRSGTAINMFGGEFD